MVSEWLLIMTNMMKGGGTEARTCGGGEDPYSPWMGQVGGGGGDDGGGGVISNMNTIVVFMAKTVKEFGMKNASSLVLIGL